MICCELCGRERELTFHHFIPKCLHKNKWFKKNFTKEEMSKGINICKHDCHPQIHRFISEKELGRYWNTLKLLLSHPEVLKYVNWVKKQQGGKQKRV